MKNLKWILPLAVVASMGVAAILLAGCGSPAAPAASTGGQPATANIQYTCPMHPEIVTNQPGDCPLCGMHLVPKT